MTLPDHGDAPSYAAPGAPPPAETKARRAPAVLVVALVAVVALFVGAGAATGVWFVTRPPDVPVHKFTVTILLENDATPEQKAAIEAALPAFKARHMPGVEEIQVVQHLVNDYAAKITCKAEYARP